MRLALAAFVLAGCGRVGFEPERVIDALGDSASDGSLAGHDEDGDGIVDSADVCPHLPVLTPDEDGDGVGDACDPEPSIARQRIALFATMTPDDQPFILEGESTWTPEADAWHCTGNVGILRLERPMSTVRIRLGVEIIARLGAVGEQHQMALGLGTTAHSSGYLTELNEGPGYSNVAITEFVGSTYTSRQAQPLPTGVHTGLVELQHDAFLSPPAVAMVGGWPGEMYTLTSPATLYTGATYAQLNTNKLEFRVRYVIVIETL